MKSAIEEIKKADPENENKSMNMEDIEVDSDQSMFDTLYANDDFIGVSIKENVAEVSDQSSMISRSITSTKQILKVNEETKDQANKEVDHVCLDGEMDDEEIDIDKKNCTLELYLKESCI